jgi:hypothetical protein
VGGAEKRSNSPPIQAVIRAQKEPSFSYFVFGLVLRSNLPIPGLRPQENSALLADLEVHLDVSPYHDGEIPPGPEEIMYISSYLDPSGNPALRIWKIAGGDFLRLEYYDGVQFWMDRKGKSVWARWSETSSLADAASYLLGPVLGLLLRHRDVICLHASAVAIEDRAVIFLGAEGSGKSTTAAAFARNGYAVLSDDIVALREWNGAFQVMPAYPHISLWPDSVKLLFGSGDALPRFTPNWEKRCLALKNEGLRFEERALPLCAIYILGDRMVDPAPYVEIVSGQTGFMALVGNTYATNVLNLEMRAKEFEFLGRLVSNVPIRRMIPHEDANHLGKLCHLICEDCQKSFPARIAHKKQAAGY